MSLELDDPGFDSSTLSAFRDRLIAGSREHHLLDAMLTHFKTAGLLNARGRQRTDSTHVLAAVRAPNRLQTIGETVRHALNVLAVAAPEWLTPLLQEDWRDRYGLRFDEYRLLKAKDERQALAEQIGADGRDLLHQIYAADAPPWLRNVAAVQTMRQVWIPQYDAVEPDHAMRWRTPDDRPPGSQMINTPDDPDARYGHKRTTEWTGYTVHVTERGD